MPLVTKNFANGFFYENLIIREYITIIFNEIETILIFEIQAHFSCFGPIYSTTLFICIYMTFDSLLMP